MYFGLKYSRRPLKNVFKGKGGLSAHYKIRGAKYEFVFGSVEWGKMHCSLTIWTLFSYTKQLRKPTKQKAKI